MCQPLHLGSGYLWVWSDPTVCQRPALWSPWCQWLRLRWWRGSRCTASLCWRLPQAPQTGRTQPDIKETSTPILALCFILQQVQKTREIKTTSVRSFKHHDFSLPRHRNSNHREEARQELNVSWMVAPSTGSTNEPWVVNIADWTTTESQHCISDEAQLYHKMTFTDSAQPLQKKYKNRCRA